MGNSTYMRDTIVRDLPARLSGQPDYLQTTDGIYATFYMPVFSAGSESG